MPERSIREGFFEHDDLSEREILRGFYREFMDFRNETRTVWNRQDVATAKLEVQVRETNGRVKDQELWRAQVAGAIKFGGLLIVPAAVGVIVWALTSNGV